MAQRHQRGWLKKEKRAQGETWVLFFRTTRKSDGKRVENKIPIGLVQHLPEASSAWAEVERLHVPINRVDVRRGLIFGDLAQHYAEHELAEASESIRPKAHTTIKGYERVLRNRLLPRWGNRIALGIKPLEVEQWLRALKKEGHLANPTLDKTRRVMPLVYKHGQRYGLIPRNQESNPMRFVRCKTTSGYEAMILTPEQAYATANSHVSPTCLSKIICGQPLSRQGFFHRIRTIMADSWMTTRDDSVFIICATASRHFSSGSEPIQRLCKLYFATATSS